MKQYFHIICFIFFPSIFIGQETFVINEQTVNKSISTSSIILEDADHQFSAHDIYKKIDGFNPIKHDVENLNFTTSTWWVKFKINNQLVNDQFLLEVARPVTNIVRLHEINSNHTLHSVTLGDDSPFDQRFFKTRDCVFPISIIKDSTKEFVLEIISDGEMVFLPMIVWNQETYLSHHANNQILHGFYYGFLAFIILIYFFFFVVMKDRSFLYYILYIAFLFLLQFSLDGYSYQYLFPNTPFWANHIVIVSAGLTVSFILLYTKSFLKIGSNKPILYYIFKGFIIAEILITILSFFGGTVYIITFPVINATSLFAIIYVLAAIVIIRKDGTYIDPFFQFAFVSVAIGAVFFMLSNFGVFDSQYIGEVSLKIASAVEVTFLSFSMANKYRALQRQKEEAQLETLKTLEEKNQLAAEINVRLENEVAERTAEVVTQKEEISEKNKEIVDSIRYAKRIQSAILPSDKIVKTYLKKSFVLYKPKDIVAGDFYWLDHMEDKVLFASADCTGHGVPGALVSVVCNNALNRSIREHGLSDPGKILDKTREIVIQEFDKSEEEVSDGMDIALCSLQLTENNYQLQYAGANNPLWIIRNGEVIETRADKQPIGRFDFNTAFNTHSFTLQKEDTIYIFSDGFIDQFGGEKGKKYKSLRLKNFLLSIQSHTMESQRDLLHKEFEQWRGKIEQIDDVCIIGVRI